MTQEEFDAFVRVMGGDFKQIAEQILKNKK
jgi:hypothetical protein